MGDLWRLMDLPSLPTIPPFHTSVSPFTPPCRHFTLQRMLWRTVILGARRERSSDLKSCAGRNHTYVAITPMFRSEILRRVPS